MIGNPEPQCLRSLSLGILLHAAGLHVQGGVLGGGPLEPGDLVVDGNEAGKGDTEGVVDPRGDGVQGPSQSVDGPGVGPSGRLRDSLFAVSSSMSMGQ